MSEGSEFLVSAEIFVSTVAGAALRKVLVDVFRDTVLDRPLLAAGSHQTKE